MFFALVLLLLISASGFVITYFYDQEAMLWARLCAGIVIGQVLLSLIGFVLGCLTGMSAGVAALSALITALPLLALSSKEINRSVRQDFAVFLSSAQKFVSHPALGQTAAFAIYFCLAILLWLFFERAMLNIDGGIGTGSLHNTGDISFHLQAIYGFLDGQNFPPQNPSFAGAKFTYPFMADLITAMLALIGAKISEAMFWQNMFLVVSLVGLMNRFTFKLTNNRFAAKVAPFILLFSGGLGFLLFFSDALKSEAGFFGLLMKLPDNYTIRADSSWRWGNSLTTLFMTQRSLLLGLPLALIILTKIWEFFSETKKDRVRLESDISNSPQRFHRITAATIIVGLLAGTLPLVHAHSFAVVMGMSACLAVMSWRKWREWTMFFAAATIASVPELFWAMRNSASKAENFLDWQIGWDNNGTNIVVFWFENAGLFIPLLLVAIVLLLVQGLKFKVPDSQTESAMSPPLTLLLFWLPFVLCFIIPNVARLAPWVWDNIKVLIYWFTISIPLVSWLLAQIWQRGKAGKALAFVFLIGLTFSGWLDVWRIASRQIEYQVFSRDAVALARQARQKLPPDAVVMSAPVHDSAAALMGRRWFLGYTGHLWSHGIDPTARENELREIYFGGAEAENLLRDDKIDYLVVGPQERDYTVVNEKFLSRFATVAQAGQYRLLQVK